MFARSTWRTAEWRALDGKSWQESCRDVRILHSVFPRLARKPQTHVPARHESCSVVPLRPRRRTQAGLGDASRASSEAANADTRRWMRDKFEGVASTSFWAPASTSPVLAGPR